MAKTAIIQARVDEELKSSVDGILSQLGITTSQAINMFYSQIKLNNGLPFELRIPNSVTLQAVEDVKSGTCLSKKFKSASNMFEDLES